jgi:hypothetical protein
MGVTFQALWNALNEVHVFVVRGGQLDFWFWLVALHIGLSIATLALGDRTVGDMMRPLRKIFSPDTDALIDGVVEVTVAIPIAVLYYCGLYVRAYLLLFRLLVGMWLALIPALVTLIALLLVLLIFFGNESSVGQSEVLMVSVIGGAWAYWYWRFDGRRLAQNMRNPWQW